MLISKIRKIVIKYHIGTFMLMMFLFVSCTKDKLVSNISNQQTKSNIQIMSANISDEDVFKSILFLDGSLTSYLGDYQNLNFRNFTTDSAEINATLQYESQIISLIKANYPSYLSTFRTDVTSGDYYRVSNAIKDAANKIYNLTLVLTNSTNNQMQTFAQSVINEFKSNTGISSNPSKGELLTAAATQKSKNFFYKWKWVAVHTAVTVVFVVEFAIAIAIPLADDNYVSEDYFSTVTLALKS